MSRLYTNKLLEMVNDGVIDCVELISNLVQYMSEDEVKDFCEYNGYDEYMEEYDV